MGRVSITALVIACLLGCAVAFTPPVGQADRSTHMEGLFAAKSDPVATFTSWVRKFGKSYHNNLEEFERRFLVWVGNLEYVLEYNSKTTTHWLGLNAMADWTHEEYKSRLGYKPDLKRLGASKASPFRYGNVVANATVDWRPKGIVTPVKNQEQCGSCWAFSTTGSVEGVNALVTGELVSLSEQELVDCDTSMDHGCRGGLMDYAFEFIMENGGLDTESDYQYTAEDAKCDLDKENHHVVTIDGYEDVPAYDEVSLAKAVTQQPVSVAIEADQRAFQLYAGGVFDAACGTQLDHGVLVVGYGSDVTEDGTPIDYWIVKNSWGAEWGDEGYIRMVRGIADSAGQCGIAMAASYPTKTSANPSPEPAPSPTPVPPGPPPAVQCDSSNTECPSGATCCCAREFFGYCFTWACCPLEEATCCDDHQHCCPSDLPVCDTVAGRCLAKEGTIEDSVEWSSKFPAIKTSGRSTFHMPWSKEQKVQQQAKQMKGVTDAAAMA